MLRLLAVSLIIAAANAECPNLCSGHGACGTNDRCTCYSSWQGSDCSERTCPFGHAWSDVATGANSAHHYAECSNRGECDRKSGECACAEGFTGHGCARHECPNGCSGHGTCETLAEVASDDSNAAGGKSYHSYGLWDAEKARVCKCDPRYSGHDCSVRMCPKGDDPLTKEVDITQTTTTSLQVDEVQNVTVQSVNGVPINGGEVTFTYTDLYNGVWTTRPVTLPNAKTWPNNNKLIPTTPDAPASTTDAFLELVASTLAYDSQSYRMEGISIRTVKSDDTEEFHYANDHTVQDGTAATKARVTLMPDSTAGQVVTGGTYELRGAMQSTANPWRVLTITTPAVGDAQEGSATVAYLASVGLVPVNGIYTHTLTAQVGAAIAEAGFALRKGDWIYVGTRAGTSTAQYGCLMQLAADVTGTSVQTYHDDSIGVCEITNGAVTSTIHIQWQMLRSVIAGTTVGWFEGSGAADTAGAWRFDRKKGIIDITTDTSAANHGLVPLTLLPGMWIRLFLKGQSGGSYCDMQVRGSSANTQILQQEVQDHIFVDPDSATSTGTQELCAGFAPTLTTGDTWATKIKVTSPGSEGSTFFLSAATGFGYKTSTAAALARGSGTNHKGWGVYYPACQISATVATPCTGSGLAVSLESSAGQAVAQIVILNPGTGYLPGNIFTISNGLAATATQELTFLVAGVEDSAGTSATSAGANTNTNVMFAALGGTEAGFHRTSQAGIAYINNAMGAHHLTQTHATAPIYYPYKANPVAGTQTIELQPGTGTGTSGTYAAGYSASATSVKITNGLENLRSDLIPYLRAGTLVYLVRDDPSEAVTALGRFVCACTIDATVLPGAAQAYFTCGAPPASIAGETPISCVNGLSTDTSDYWNVATAGSGLHGVSIVLFPYNSLSYAAGITDEFNSYKFQHLQAGDSVRVSGSVAYQASSAKDSNDAATYEINSIDPAATGASALFFKVGSKPNGGGMHPMLPIVGTVAFDEDTGTPCLSDGDDVAQATISGISAHATDPVVTVGAGEAIGLSAGQNVYIDTTTTGPAANDITDGWYRVKAITAATTFTIETMAGAAVDTSGASVATDAGTVDTGASCVSVTYSPQQQVTGYFWLPSTMVVQPVVAAKAFAGTAAADTWATTDTNMLNSAMDVKRVLEELPNGVIGTVGVTMTANTVGLYAYSVTFTGDGDSGNQHSLVMNSEGCNVDGCQPRYTGVGVQSSANAWDLVVTASSLTVAAWNNKYTTTTHGGRVNPAGGEKLIIYQGFEGAMNGKSIVTRSATDAAAGIVTDGQGSAQAKEPSQILIVRFKGDTNPVDNTKYFKSETIEITRGTKESSECSGRGACDGDAGLCECYDGYTGDACELQTVLL